jgi:hypothetical protein
MALAAKDGLVGTGPEGYPDSFTALVEDCQGIIAR